MPLWQMFQMWFLLPWYGGLTSTSGQRGSRLLQIIHYGTTSAFPSLLLSSSSPHFIPLIWSWSSTRRARWPRSTILFHIWIGGSRWSWITHQNPWLPIIQNVSSMARTIIAVYISYAFPGAFLFGNVCWFILDPPLLVQSSGLLAMDLPIMCQLFPRIPCKGIRNLCAHSHHAFLPDNERIRSLICVFSCCCYSMESAAIRQQVQRMSAKKPRFAADLVLVRR